MSFMTFTSQAARSHAEPLPVAPAGQTCCWPTSTGHYDDSRHPHDQCLNTYCMLILWEH